MRKVIGFLAVLAFLCSGNSVAGTTSSPARKAARPPARVLVHPAAAMTPAPATTGAPFTPPQIGNLSAWYDASSSANFSLFGSSIAAWKDQSGNGNTLAQTSAAREPSYVSSGIDGKPSVAFNGTEYLASTNAAFSSKLFNESSVFVVTSQANATQDSAVLFSGLYDANRYGL